MTKISLILLPNYYKAPSFRLLNKIIEQEFYNFELILPKYMNRFILTKKELKTFISKNKIRCIYINQANYNAYLLSAVEHASGKFVLFANDDDYFAPGALKKICRVSEKCDSDIIKFDIFYHFLNEKDWNCDSNHSYNLDKNSPTFSLRFHPNFLNYYCFIFGSLYKAEFLLKSSIKIGKGNIVELINYSFYVQALLNSAEITYFNENIYHHFDTFDNNKSNYKDNVAVDSLCDNADCLTEALRNCNYLNDQNLNSIFNNINYFASIIQANCGYSGYFANKYKNSAQKFNFNLYSPSSNVSQKFSQISFSSPINSIISNYPKILIYNWLPYDNPWNWGGGVNIYCRNLIQSLLINYPLLEIYFLSSGFAYQASTTKTYVRQIGSLLGDRCKQFEIVNSPVPAMQRNLYVNPSFAIKNKKLQKVFEDFISKHGPFKTIHFNNIEGMSLDVFELKNKFKKTNFVYSMHNYIPICVTGGYYMRHNHSVCNPKHTKNDCFKCTRSDIIRDVALVTYNRGLYGINKNDALPKKEWIKKVGIENLDKNISIANVFKFTEEAKRQLNTNCDSILAVSKRVYDLAVSEGINAKKMFVSYIGTKFADYQMKCSNSNAKAKINVIFLGSDLFYEEKGYPFLIKSLKMLKRKYASKVNLTLTLLQADQNKKVIHSLRHFNSVNIINGYKPDDLKGILKGQHLSIIPVVWEDNLPQIAIESVANGVPILASDFGGASELCSSPMFKFKGGNSADFLRKFEHFIEKPSDINLFWRYHNGLITMKEHCNDLLKYYGVTKNELSDKITLSHADFSFLLQEHNFLKYYFECSFQNYNEIRKRAENWNMINSKLIKMFPYGSKRRKLIKSIYFRKSK